MFPRVLLKEEDIIVYPEVEGVEVIVIEIKILVKNRELYNGCLVKQ